MRENEVLGRDISDFLPLFVRGFRRVFVKSWFMWRVILARTFDYTILQWLFLVAETAIVRKEFEGASSFSESEPRVTSGPDLWK